MVYVDILKKFLRRLIYKPNFMCEQFVSKTDWKEKVKWCQDTFEPHQYRLKFYLGATYPNRENYVASVRFFFPHKMDYAMFLLAWGHDPNE